MKNHFEIGKMSKWDIFVRSLLTTVVNTYYIGTESHMKITHTHPDILNICNMQYDTSLWQAWIYLIDAFNFRKFQQYWEHVRGCRDSFHSLSNIHQQITILPHMQPLRRCVILHNAYALVNRFYAVIFSLLSNTQTDNALHIFYYLHTK